MFDSSHGSFPWLARIGYLSTVSPSSAVPSIKAFREGLAQLGYLDGQNIAVEYRYAEGKLGFSEAG
ncbi:MAG: hypothetical protein E6J54_09425 [Deltaproteobacteria bacterium]|nr:MAG: hypothetical protein E6J54_09425 [Deltaproteobacteria bacterium]